MINLLGAIAGPVIGAIAGRADQRRADRRAAKERANALDDDAQRFVRLREAAQAGGFNPLTALQYNFGSNLPSGVAAPLSTSQFWQQGATAAADELTGAAGLRRAQDALQTRMTEINIERAEAEIGAIGRMMTGGVGAAPLAGSAVSVGAGFNGSYNTPSGFPGAMEPGYATGLGVDWAFDPNVTDAEVAETRYGDVASNVFGLANVVADTVHNLRDVPFWGGFNIEPGGLADRAMTAVRGALSSAPSTGQALPPAFNAPPLVGAPAVSPVIPRMGNIGGGSPLVDPLNPFYH